MTIELEEYRCPSCGQLLGEIEYRNVCEKHKMLLDQKSQERLSLQRVQYEKMMQQQHEKHNLEKDKEVNIRVEKQLNQEKVWMQLRQSQELEQVRQQAADQADEKIKQAINQNEARHLQTEKQYELKLKRLEDQIEKQQKIIDSTSPELRGTAGELVLQHELEKEFENDKFVPKQVGIEMADIVQTIVTNKGEAITTPIVYDVKMGNKVTKYDIAKAKNYMSKHKTPHSIIVTTDIKNERYTEVIDGVLLVHPLVVIDIARQIRNSLIETGVLIRNNTNRNTKESKMYSYFTSHEYTRKVTQRIELKLKYDTINRKVEALRKQENGCVEKLVELDYEIDAIITDITQEDSDIQNELELINDEPETP